MTSINAVPVAAIIAAWADQSSWVSSALPSQMASTAIPTPQPYDVPPVGACAANEGPDGPDQPTCYSSGQGTVALSSMQVSQLGGSAIATATVNGTSINFPLSFTSLVVDGSFNYNQPCTCSYMRIHDSSSAGSNGGITQSITNGTLTIEGTWQNNQVVLTSVSVGGSTTTTLNPDNGGMPDWLASFVSYVSNDGQVNANLSGTLGSVFQGAPFIKQVLDLVNKQLGQGAA